MRRFSINTPVVEPDIASEREHLGGYHERALSRGFASGGDVFVGAGSKSVMKDAIAALKVVKTIPPRGDEEDATEQRVPLMSFRTWTSNWRQWAMRTATVAIARKRGRSTPSSADTAFASNWLSGFMRRHGIKVGRVPGFTS